MNCRDKAHSLLLSHFFCAIIRMFSYTHAKTGVHKGVVFMSWCLLAACSPSPSSLFLFFSRNLAYDSPVATVGTTGLVHTSQRVFWVSHHVQLQHNQLPRGGQHMKCRCGTVVTCLSCTRWLPRRWFHCTKNGWELYGGGASSCACGSGAEGRCKGAMFWAAYGGTHV